MFKWLKNLFGGKKTEETKPTEEVQATPEASVETPSESTENVEMSASEEDDE